MAYICTDVLAGSPDLYVVDTLGPGPLAGLAAGPTTRGFSNYPGLEIRGYDQFLGGGTFIFGRAAGTLAAGAVCELGTTVSATNRFDVTMTAWAGTVNSGKPLAVTLTALTVGQYGWFQVEGNAIATTAGAPAAGNSAYFSAAGSIQPTLVASKQALNAVYVSAAAAQIGPVGGSGSTTLSATQAVVLLNRPVAQSNIT
jgi:hypothetical protein